MAVQDTLPDPNYKRFVDGTNDASGTTGPGFAQVKLTNDQKILTSRTNSQRLLARAIVGQKWKIDINYNPMTQEEFAPVFAFLLEKQGPMNPFFVSLPQYRTWQNSSFNSFVTTFGTHGTWTPRVKAAVVAGKTEFILQAYDHSGGGIAPAPSQTASSHNGPVPGDMITFHQGAATTHMSGDATHSKAYLITSVETTQNNKTESADNNIGATEWRLNVSPPLAKNISQNLGIALYQPKVKVIMPQPLSTYTLNKDNLYSFSLKLEEYL